MKHFIADLSHELCADANTVNHGLNGGKLYAQARRRTKQSQIVLNIMGE